MRFLSISEDSPTLSRSETASESTMEVFRLVNGSFAEGSPVRDIRSQDSDSPIKTSAIYGQSVHEHLANYDPQSQSLRTCQGSLALTEDDSSTEFCLIFPRAGMMRSGKLYRLSTLVLRTSESGSGLSVPRWNFPTPTANPEAPIEVAQKNWSPGMMWQTPVADDAVERENGKVNSRGEPKLSAQVLWSTPRAHELGDYTRDRGKKGAERLSLTGQAKLWSTPHGFSKDGKLNGPSGNELGRAVNLFPTPKANSSTGAGEHGTGGPNLQTVVGGSLNPEFVEWLMGYPKKWTDIEADCAKDVSEDRWESEWIDTPRVSTGTKNRVNRLKGLGNSIVPECAEVIFNLPFFDRFRA